VGTLELVPDPVRRGGRTLLIDGLTHGHVDLDDPTRLEVDYVARIGAALEVLLPRGAEASVLHVGGGAFSLPRMVAATRPHATQTVIERSAAVVRLAEQHLRLRRGPRLRVLRGDAADVVPRLDAASFDLVVGDAFVGTEIPERLSDDAYAAQVRRALRRDGRYLLNVVDQPPWSVTVDHAERLRRTLGAVVGFGGREVARGRHAGNVLLLGGTAPLPVERLRRAVAGGAHPAELLPPDRLGG